MPHNAEVRAPFKVTGTPKPWRLMASFLYESLMIVSIWLAVVVLLTPVTFILPNPTIKNYVIQITILLILFVYFVWQWQKTGQTLATRTWHLAILSADYKILTPKQALMRGLWGGVLYVALPLLMYLGAEQFLPVDKALWLMGLVFCLPVVWVWVHPKHFTLLDVVAGSVVVAVAKH
jgi:uncharacterized RDD family membrane protein YckC